MKTCAITLIKFSAFAATVLASPASLVQRQAITIATTVTPNAAMLIFSVLRLWTV